MIIYLTKNISGTIKRLLSTYHYEVSSGVYVGSYQALLHSQILDFLKKNISGKQQILVLRRDPMCYEGFSDEYLNWPSNKVNFNGLNLYRIKKFLKISEDNLPSTSKDSLEDLNF